MAKEAWTMPKILFNLACPLLIFLYQNSHGVHVEYADQWPVRTKTNVAGKFDV
jgi:hypothetical protein